MITKQYSYVKPTLDDVKRAIRSLKEECLKYDVKKLAMPRIGCGLDKLKWRDVQSALYEEFCQSDIELKIYNLKDVSVITSFVIFQIRKSYIHSSLPD